MEYGRKIDIIILFAGLLFVGLSYLVSRDTVGIMLMCALGVIFGVIYVFLGTKSFQKKITRQENAEKSNLLTISGIILLLVALGGLIWIIITAFAGTQ